ncbi:hypothetical protein [Pseudomonas sp. Au-Pse12]|uniref:hypothetical protein n=1 Tax=Pseudomonas sp. Au-Pse12 TaxID=2906459 RepID=UPI001E2AD8DB|nr:hypothetical protein [Pseudomonas sp. Au-Pse12]MCE4055444.1 hypothetical protein [Pseudomonas sp. Au-Pse12]
MIIKKTKNVLMQLLQPSSSRQEKAPHEAGPVSTRDYFLFGSALGKNIVLLATGTVAVFLLLTTTPVD